MNKIYDVLIIGGGPGGIYSSIIGSLINVNSVIVESNPFLGGQPMQLYAEKNIHDFPGFEEILPATLINGMVQQMNGLENKPNIFLNTFIESIDSHNGIFDIQLNNGQKINSNFIIVATGSGNFLPIKNEILEKIDFDNIHYVFGNIEDYRNKKIIILGGGDSALDWANFLIDNKITSEVSLIHRRNEFKAREEKVKKLNDNNIEKFMDYKIENILKNKIIIKSNNSDYNKELNYDFLIVQYGQKINLENKINIFQKINKNENGKFKVDMNCKTNLNNIYAIGNANYFESKPNLIISACSEGARAMYHIRNEKKKIK